jgi:hypothetical protein
VRLAAKRSPPAASDATGLIGGVRRRAAGAFEARPRAQRFGFWGVFDRRCERRG